MSFSYFGVFDYRSSMCHWLQQPVGRRIAYTLGNNDRDDVMYMIFCKGFMLEHQLNLFLSLLCLFISDDGKAPLGEKVYHRDAEP